MSEVRLLTAETGAIGPFSERLFAPVDVDVALSWRGRVLPEATMTTEKPSPSRQRDPWTRVT